MKWCKLYICDTVKPVFLLFIFIGSAQKNLISITFIFVLFWVSFYPTVQVVVPLDQLRVVNPSASMWNPAEKYIQIVTTDNHEFWFMGFVSYDKALKNLLEALHQAHSGANRTQTNS